MKSFKGMFTIDKSQETVSLFIRFFEPFKNFVRIVQRGIERGDVICGNISLLLYLEVILRAPRCASANLPSRPLVNVRTFKAIAPPPRAMDFFRYS